MTVEHRQQGQTRQAILELLRRHHQMTAAELSESLQIGAVGIRQHLALLERDGLVCSAGVRRGVGRPSHLYTLTPRAESSFPKRYDRLVMDALAFIEAQGGPQAIDQLFATRQRALAEQYAPRLAGKSRADQVAELAAILNEQGYMCEWQELPDGSFVLSEHNCPVECAANSYRQACAHEQMLYQEILGVPLTRDETIAEGGGCCRYRIASDQG